MGRPGTQEVGRGVAGGHPLAGRSNEIVWHPSPPLHVGEFLPAVPVEGAARAPVYGETMDIRESFDKVKEYFKEVYLETKRVTFPSRKETMKGTYVVLITVFVAAVFLGIVDVGLAKVLQVLFRG